MTGRAATQILKIAVSLVLLVWVGARLDWAAAGAALARLRAGTLAVAVVLALAGYWGRALRWSWLLRQGGVGLSPWASYRLTLVGTFYGLVTPGRIGELARAWHLDLPRARTLPSVVWDRAADVLLLEVMAIPAFVALDAWHGPLLWSYLAVVGATAALVVVLDSAPALALLRRLAPWTAQRLAGWEQGATGMLLSPAFARGLGAGLFFYALNFAGAFLMLRDLTPSSPPQLALVFPVIILLGNLPIAFGGLGLREQVAATAFARFGSTAAAGPVFSLLWFAVITLLPGLIGVSLAQTRWGRAAGVLHATDGSGAVAPEPRAGGAPRG